MTSNAGSTGAVASTTDPPKVQDSRKDAGGILKYIPLLPPLFRSPGLTTACSARRWPQSPSETILKSRIPCNSIYSSQFRISSRKLSPASSRKKTELSDLPTSPRKPFQRYMRWLYDGNLPKQLAWNEHLDVYAFGIFIQDDRFCNAAIDKLISYTTTTKPQTPCYPTALASKACSKLPFTSPSVKLLVDSAPATMRSIGPDAKD